VASKGKMGSVTMAKAVEGRLSVGRSQGNREGVAAGTRATTEEAVGEDSLSIEKMGGRAANGGREGAPMEVERVLWRRDGEGGDGEQEEAGKGCLRSGPVGEGEEGEKRG
jgi:hypothetical protein